MRVHTGCHGVSSTSSLFYLFFFFFLPCLPFLLDPIFTHLTVFLSDIILLCAFQVSQFASHLLWTSTCLPFSSFPSLFYIYLSSSIFAKKIDLITFLFFSSFRRFYLLSSTVFLYFSACWELISNTGDQRIDGVTKTCTMIWQFCCHCR